MGKRGLLWGENWKEPGGHIKFTTECILKLMTDEGWNDPEKPLEKT